MNSYFEPGWKGGGGPEEGPDSTIKLLQPGQGNWPAPGEAQISHWKLAGRHKLTILSFVLLGAMGGGIYVILRIPTYRAITTVEVVGFNQSFMGMSQVDPQAGTDGMTASASNIQTQTRILTSATILNRVDERMNLEMTPVTSTPETFFTKLRRRIPFIQSEPLVRSRDALKEAEKTVAARGVGTSRLIEIQCDSTSPEVAAEFVNTLAAEHAAQALAARSNLTQRTSQWMDSQLEEAKARLQEAGEDLRGFVQKSGMDFFPEQSTLADSKLRQLQTDLAGIQADRIAKQSRWELAQSAQIQDLPNFFNDANLQALKVRLEELRRDRAQFLATLTPEHYKVKRIQAQITETEQTLETERVGLLKHLKNDYEEALRHEKLLGGAYSAQTRTVSSQADKSAEYSTKKRAVDMAQQLYSALLQESTQAALMALAPANSIRVVDPAQPESIPSNPKPVRDIPAAALLGGALGYGMLYLNEIKRRKKRTRLFDAPGNTQTILGVPELGVIPSAQLKVPKRNLGFQTPVRVLNRGSVATLGAAVQNGHSETPEILSWRGSKSSLLAESFRQALVSILRTRPRNHNPVYVITSAGPAEGKTTMSANLAVAMAETGQRVLLIDADLRRPRVHALFGARDHKGLSDLLMDPEPVDTLALPEYLQPTGIDNFQVVTRGLAEVETPALLFFSPRVQELLARLQTEFGCIIIDTAPALPYPDARLWGKYSDGVVLIVRSRITTREGAATACQRFLDDGIPVLGSILNDWAPRDHGEQGGYLYGYYSDSKMAK